jgi:hypothetical protein
MPAQDRVRRDRALAAQCSGQQPDEDGEDARPATGSAVALFPVAIGEHSCQHRVQDAGAYDRLLAASPSFHQGAPVRLRNEVQLGLKMVKWIKGVE